MAWCSTASLVVPVARVFIPRCATVCLGANLASLAMGCTQVLLLLLIVMVVVVFVVVIPLETAEPTSCLALPAK